MSGELKGGGASLISDSGGTILQVKQTVKTDKESQAFSGTTKNVFYFIPAQGGSGVFQENITITGSNKILIDVRLGLSNTGSNTSTFWSIFRGAATDTVIGSCTKIAIGTEAAGDRSATTGVTNLTGEPVMIDSQSMLWLDNPGAGTYYYKIGWGGENSTSGVINRSDDDTDVYYTGSTPSTITLMEVAV